MEVGFAGLVRVVLSVFGGADDGERMHEKVLAFSLALMVSCCLCWCAGVLSNESLVRLCFVSFRSASLCPGVGLLLGFCAQKRVF